jgi:ubiquinone/menaquinone biosynthesis C-methylase UbiE
MAMENKQNTKVCPVWLSGMLDNFIRRIFHQPGRILKKYVKENMTVLDLGCGPGFFTLPVAEWVGPAGKVIAADLQDDMLDIIRNKIRNKGYGNRIVFHHCSEDKIGLTGPVDFVLAFYMIHETPDRKNLFRELKSIIKPGCHMLIVEPLFHVTKKEFDKMVNELSEEGYSINESPGVFLSRAILISYNNVG